MSGKRVTKKRLREMYAKLAMDADPHKLFDNICSKTRQMGTSVNSIVAAIIHRCGVETEEEALALAQAMQHPELLNRDTHYRTIDDE